MEKLVLIDGNSLINRAFYAMPLLTTKKGTYTNGVFGFMNMFFKMAGEVKPDYVAVAFDMRAPTFRHKAYAEYKGTRKPMPEELRPQIPLLKDLLRLMGVYVTEKEGVEADDIIGTIAKHTRIKTFIYTGDKDSFQLVDKETTVMFTRRGITDTEQYDADNFKEKTGIDPKQIIDLKALMGDASDNIPGVSGVGEKTAKSLISEYGSLDGVYANLDKISGKLQEKLTEEKDAAYMSYSLATINVDCGVNTDVNLMRFKTPFNEEVRKAFIELEFKSLVKSDLFDKKSELLDKKEEDLKITEIENENQAKELLNGKIYALVLSEKAVNLSDGREEYFISVNDAAEATLFDCTTLSQALKIISPVFSKGKTLVLFDKKENKKIFLKHGVKPDADIEDVAIIKYLVDFTSGGENLTEVIEEYDKNAKTPALSLFKIYGELKEKFTEEVESLYKNMELPLADVLLEMENFGFKVDAKALEQTGEKYVKIMAESEKKIKETTGEPDLNVNSPFQLGEILFKKMRIGSGKKTKKGYSTSAEVLEQYEDRSPVITEILKYRRIQKLQSAYIEGIKPLIEKDTGLIHTCFNQTMTATGRLSSKEPNLQNIPIREEEGRELRKFFVAKGENRVLIDADYSQIELRLLAAFSDCKGLIAAFKNGEDVHVSTAAKVFNVDAKDVTESMRRNAKAVNFGIIYGISDFGLSQNLKIPKNMAKDYIDAYFKQFPEVKEYMRKNVEFAMEHGYIETFMGRRRYIREINAQSYRLRQFGERAAMNMPLQGSAADIIKLAMLAVSSRLKREGLKSELILQVHDELVIDAFEEEREQVIKLLKEEMEGAANLSVPLTVGIGCGKTWFDAK